MRISDWSSDVCSSDLLFQGGAVDLDAEAGTLGHRHDAVPVLNGLRDDGLAVRIEGAVNLELRLVAFMARRARWQDGVDVQRGGQHHGGAPRSEACCGGNGF